MPDFKVIVRNSGPYRLEGEGITICDQEGRVYGLAGRTVVSLCRCRHSANKPFCDGRTTRSASNQSARPTTCRRPSRRRSDQRRSPRMDILRES